MGTQSAAHIRTEIAQVGHRGRPVDLVHLARQTHGNKDLETEVLRMFMVQSASLLVRLAAAASPKERFEIAHQLKGSARSIGANSVAECSEALEIASHTGIGWAPALKNVDSAVMIANAFIDAVID